MNVTELTIREVLAACKAQALHVTLDPYGTLRMGGGHGIEGEPVTIEELAQAVGWFPKSVRALEPGAFLEVPDGVHVHLVANAATPPGYESLAGILQRAMDQASKGKGAERHANSLPFHAQPMQRISDAVGVGFTIGQAMKKAEESQSLPPGRDVAELLGAINYLAGAIIYIERTRAKADSNG